LSKDLSSDAWEIIQAVLGDSPFPLGHERLNLADDDARLLWNVRATCNRILRGNGQHVAGFNVWERWRGTGKGEKNGRESLQRLKESENDVDGLQHRSDRMHHVSCTSTRRSSSSSSIELVLTLSTPHPFATAS
jgi:hypothetical protein